MRIKTIEMLVGLFMLAGVLALFALALKVSGINSYMGGESYLVTASFDNIGNLKVHAPVTVAGVRVGEVSNINLDSANYKAIVTLEIDANSKIPDDSSASILTQGLVGSNYVSLTPGFDETYLKNGSRIDDTHPALVLENLIGELLFSIKDKVSDKDSDKDKTTSST